MEINTIQRHANSIGLLEGLDYLKQILIFRLNNRDVPTSNGIASISLTNCDSSWVNFVKSKQPLLEEYLSVLLALAPHLHSDFFDKILKEHFPDGNQFPAFGGVRGKNHRGILPTGETAQFVIAGNDLAKRITVQSLFGPQHWFATDGILRLETVPPGEPVMSGRLILDAEWLERIITGTVSLPRFSPSFPAEQLLTSLEWEDLILPQTTLKQVRELLTWIEHREAIQGHEALQKHLKPGYRVLFHGPPGTGKTLTASLLGKAAQRPVFRVDLSMVVSKYIGETEKNLANLFDKAANKDWILFFDEADALFGKRTEIRDARDKFANQESAFLLQKVESFPGLVILASNFKKNMDEAFARRFQSIVYFPSPDAEHRLLLWLSIIPKQLKLDKEIDLKKIADTYAFSGSNIVNIVHYCSLQVLSTGSQRLSLDLLTEGIRREYRKEERLS